MGHEGCTSFFMKVAHLFAVLFGFATVCLSQQGEISLVTSSGEPFPLARLEKADGDIVLSDLMGVKISGKYDLQGRT